MKTERGSLETTLKVIGGVRGELPKTAQHTQGEWIVSGNQIRIKDKQKSIATVHVCKNFDADKWKNVQDIEMEANAQRIVKAVNSFDEMKEALQLALDILSMGNYPTSANDPRFIQINKAVKLSE